MARHHHVLNAASNLLGIALLIITGLRVSGLAARSIGDEIAWCAAACFSIACVLSYAALRREPEPSRFESWADRVFMIGLLALVACVAVFGLTDL
ncbi:hypothetical protein ACFSTD_03015 [Novosphingobium colocasiae]|uniref:Uncharacterized protein n=1 Tax=Novosphingobium colocasiae TaxID=1256513 RepID=A0A918UE74_9SPHN|nr:hypothetical protein [Novosphingobium colocasiae]GGY99486.1 hypothetical protein GCM10011614_13020 [Novosphingobium colocasiae]